MSNFIGQIGRILNSGQTQCIVLTGNIYDQFYSKDQDQYEPLLQYLLHKWDLPITRNIIKIVYELNGPINFLHPEDKPPMQKAWHMLVTGQTPHDSAIERLAKPYLKHESKELDSEFEDLCTTNAIGNPTTALEFLRQLCQASRLDLPGNPLKDKELLIVIEGADMMLPVGTIGQLSAADRQNVAICRDWLCDPGFTNAGDAVVFLSESKAKLNAEVAQLPHLLSVTIPGPDLDSRHHFITWYLSKHSAHRPTLWSTEKELASYTAGLSLLAIMQLLKSAAHTGQRIEPEQVSEKIERFLISQLGEGVVEFKKPTHTLDDVIGNTKLKQFIHTWFIPRIQHRAIAGAAVGGAIGVGKSFLFEAVATHLDIPVLVLKNIRSKWFGETDVIFERLRRILEVFHQVLIFVDEADTQFGGVGQETHGTERRLTGKIQAMMADPALKGRVIWLLLTARINLLSEDLLRRGRAGDVIFALTDPQGQDRRDFIEWVLSAVTNTPDDDLIQALEDLTEGYSAADFSSLRGDLKTERNQTDEGVSLTTDQIKAIVYNRIPSDLADFRRIQTLHALSRCTDRRLLPDDYPDIAAQRGLWKEELSLLETLQR